MPPSANREAGRLDEFRTDEVQRFGALGECGEHVEGGKRGRRLL